MTLRQRTRATFRRTPLTLRASLPSVGWVDLVAQLKTRLADVDWDHRLPGGPAKVNIKLVGEHRLIPGTLLALFDGPCPVWSGEIESTDPDPKSKVTTITGRGRVDTMQDGLVYDKTYIRADMSKWYDLRVTGTSPSLVTGHANNEIDKRAIKMGWPNGSNLPAPAYLGVTTDLGPNNTGKVMVGTYFGSANATDIVLYGSSSLGATNNFFGPVTLTAAGGSLGIIGTIPTPTRAPIIFWYRGTGGVTGAETWSLFTALAIYTDAAYQSSGASVLKVDTVAKDIVANAGIPHISTSVALIAAGTTNIQELESGGDNPKSLLDRANATDGMQWMFNPDPIPALVLRAEPTTPRWAPLPGEIQLEGGANASSIADVFNAVRVRWKSAAGAENVTTATLTPDTTVLARIGRTRTADINVSRICSSTEAAAIAAAFLRQHRQAPMKASIKTTVPWIRTASGMRMPISMLTVGDRVRLPIRDAATGAIGREGTIYGVAVNPRTGVATISLDSDTTIFDRQLAYFESRAAA